MELSKFIQNWFQSEFDQNNLGSGNRTTIGDICRSFSLFSHAVTEREVSDEIHSLIESGGIFSFLMDRNGFYFPATQTEFEKHRKSKIRQSQKLINECMRLNSLNFIEYTKARKETKDGK